MNRSMEGRVVVVTGGNSGIGRGTAIAFSEAGAKVVIAARRVREGEETVDEIKSVGGDARFVRTDVTSEAEVEAMIDFTVSEYGRLDAAFNNAGFIKRIPLVEMTEQQFDEMLAVDLKGMWFCLKHEIRHMLKNERGTIVNMSSGYGLFASPSGVSGFAACAHGVVGLTKAAALEYAGSGIRVNAVLPTWILSKPRKQGDAAAEARDQKILSNLPLRRKGTTAEVGQAVLWLCSDASSYVNGHSMLIDGGVMAWTGGM
jgi:NAD(P)-dependent dehydrogenase (short-subunit alcohol dehydrogenase family)